LSELDIIVVMTDKARALGHKEDATRLAFMLGIALALLARGQDLGGGLPEGREAQNLSPLEHRVWAELYPGAHFARSFSGNSQTDLAGTAQTKVTAIAMPLYPADPTFCPAWFDQQVEAIAITDPSGSGCCLYSGRR